MKTKKSRDTTNIPVTFDQRSRLREFDEAKIGMRWRDLIEHLLSALELLRSFKQDGESLTDTLTRLKNVYDASQKESKSPLKHDALKDDVVV